MELSVIRCTPRVQTTSVFKCLSGIKCTPRVQTTSVFMCLSGIRCTPRVQTTSVFMCYVWIETLGECKPPHCLCAAGVFRECIPPLVFMNNNNNNIWRPEEIGSKGMAARKVSNQRSWFLISTLPNNIVWMPEEIGSKGMAAWKVSNLNRAPDTSDDGAEP